MENNKFNWGPGLFIIAYHAALLLALPWYLWNYTPQWSVVLTSIVLFFLSGLSITGGYHRLYAHRAYRVHRAVEWVLFWFGSLAAQGSILRWGYDHRLHHAHVDTDEDPYSINKGFWYAHILWIFESPSPIDPKVVPDLVANRLVSFQDRYYLSCMLFTNVITCLLVGWLFNDYVGSIVIAGLLRIFALHHATWFINSLAHTWGWKPFCQEQSAVDNFFLSLVTFGEGYHNYHHTFANDYRNGIRWYHFDPTKWLIWMLSKVGLASHLRRTDWLVVKKRMVLERKNLLLQRLGNAVALKQTELQQRVHELAELLVSELTAINELRKQNGKEVQRQLKNVQKSFRDHWSAWHDLSRLILQEA